ncbi:hypothetical protein [Actinomadura vinacea]|uniref:hypothetical protein n=1 Tax=Actinomadura vinacea TaxID=115336 RepID=UPI0031E13354
MTMILTFSSGYIRRRFTHTQAAQSAVPARRGPRMRRRPPGCPRVTGLVFIEHGTRGLHLGGVTARPTGA